ncbi:ROK family protein [Labrys monachus]|uniref:NBD/HSP70 family sugar kinase n=1 Tax=Labrys monachus TaxID=217067 RepID=A0ABU0FFE0_9HYPH|nr:ROK family protein [Labrys monachus]MDQ0393323.1 putative NBD/HSP70 family sugar kinase [Labrys monachus]
MAKAELRSGLRIGRRAPDDAGPAVSGTTDRVRALESERQSLAALLDILRKAEAATRLDLEREARLGRAVVADRLATLARFGLVDEGGVGRSIGGRAPRLLRFRAEAGRLLVANIHRGTIGVGLADLGGRLITEHYEDIDLAISADALFERLEQLFSWLLDQVGMPDLWGIGLGIPGPVESQEGPPLAIPRLGATPEWESARLIERLVCRFGVPAWVRGAVQMETMGELGTVAPELGRDMVFVDLGTEISAGVVSNGRLHRGGQGTAGQIGHVYAGEGHMAICGCGNTGCLETVAGCEAVVVQGLQAARRGHSRALADILERNGGITVADIGTAARLGDPFSADLLARCGRLVGTVLATLVNLLNPSMVVVGGELALTGDICIAAIREGIYRHSQPLLTRDLGIVRSRMGRSSGLAGATKVVAEEIFAPAFMEGWITAGSPLAHPDVLRLLEAARKALTAGSGRTGPAPSARTFPIGAPR